MKLKCASIIVLVVVMVACASGVGGGGAGGGLMGDIAPGNDGPIGGISEVPNPSAEMARKSGTALATLQRGHVVYMLKCGECHMYQLPEHLDIEDWEYAVPEMIAHAGLPKSDEKAVLAYVVAVKQQKGQ